MRTLITGTLVALALGATAAAQDSKVTTQTKVSGDDARAVTMRGCLQRAPAGDGFLMVGAISSSGDDLKSKTTVKTDVDDDDVTVKAETKTKIDKDDDAVGTSGTVSTFTVMPRSGVDLAAHAGEEVEINAVMIDARRGNDDDAEIEVKEETKVERDDAKDVKTEDKTEIEVPRGATAQLMAMSVKGLGTSCAK